MSFLSSRLIFCRSASKSLQVKSLKREDRHERHPADHDDERIGGAFYEQECAQNDEVEPDRCADNPPVGTDVLVEMAQNAPVNDDIHDQIKDRTQRSDA